ncbi:MAG: AMP-binding protein [Oligoflexales bacterium]|nr:AMP-binding protein [Oligoflexales bacterium]
MDRIWLKSYPKGIPSDINPEAYTSLVDLSEECFRKYRDLPAFTCMGTTITYGELDRRSQELATYFLEVCDLQKGDRVALMMPNILPYPITLHAVLRAGLTAVNVNPLYTARELEHQLADSGAKVIVILENFAHVLAQVIGKTAVQHVLVNRLGDGLSFPKNHLVNFVVKRLKKLVPAFSITNVTVEAWVRACEWGKKILAGKGTFRSPPIQSSDLAFLQYTGGTTGVSKGAMLSHRNMVANIEQAYAWMNPYAREGQELIVTALPLYHIFSLTANCLTFMKIGGHNLLITNPKDIKGFIEELKKYRFTAFTGVNTLFNALLNREEFRSLDFSSLRLTLGGGMAVQRAVAERWKQVTGTPLHPAYGLTETSPAACISPLIDSDFPNSVGLPLPSTWFSIRDEAGAALPSGQIGEVCIQGPQIMQGYWGKVDETEKVMLSTPEGRWLKTGDVGFLDEKGFCTLVDRKKDMILVSGFNVYPNEIEDVLALHEGLIESAAVGMKDEKSGEVIKVYAVKRNENLTAEDVIAHCRKYLTAYKVPKFVEFRTELPKTNVGKILRRSLKENFSETAH